MIARIQRALTLGALLLGIGCVIWGLTADRPLFALIAAVAWLGGYAAVMAMECVLAAFVQRHEAPPQPSLGLRVRAWWEEVCVAPRVFCWWQPFRAQAVSDHLPEEATRGVLLVHGYLCNRGFWTPWMRRLRELGVPYIAVSLEPVFGSIDEYIQLIDDAARRLAARTGHPPLVVAHSMGGLAVRRWQLQAGARERVHHIITLGTPHHGTWLARFGVSTNAREMRIGSEWLEALRRDEKTSGVSHRHYTCVIADCDNVVFPVGTAALTGATVHRVAGAAHIDLVHRPQVFEWALQHLHAPRQPAPKA